MAEKTAVRDAESAVGPDSQKLWANVRTAYPDALTGSGAHAVSGDFIGIHLLLFHEAKLHQLLLCISYHLE